MTDDQSYSEEQMEDFSQEEIEEEEVEVDGYYSDEELGFDDDLDLSFLDEEE